jgi:hypothetical protein
MKLSTVWKYRVWLLRLWGRRAAIAGAAGLVAGAAAVILIERLGAAGTRTPVDAESVEETENTPIS